MAGSVNKVILVGNLGQDPEIRTTQDGKEIANFSIATSESWKDKNSGERKEKTEWHRIVAFNDGLVNVIKNYVKKGTKVYIEGALQTRKWQDQNGQERYTTEVVLQGYNSSLTMLDSRNSGEQGSGFGGGSYQNNNQSFGGGAPAGGPGNASQPQNAPQESNFIAEELDDEIPF